MLIDEMKAAGEEEPVILPALWVRKNNNVSKNNERFKKLR